MKKIAIVSWDMSILGGINVIVTLATGFSKDMRFILYL